MLLPGKVVLPGVGMRVPFGCMVPLTEAGIVTLQNAGMGRVALPAGGRGAVPLARGIVALFTVGGLGMDALAEGIGSDPDETAAGNARAPWESALIFLSILSHSPTHR